MNEDLKGLMYGRIMPIEGFALILCLHVVGMVYADRLCKGKILNDSFLIYSLGT